MRVTIRDVARDAGVSPSTVSRVLNQTCPVHDEKRRQVLAASQRLGYRPNPAARSLLGKRTGGLGVLLPFVSGEFFSELLNGIDEAAQELGLFLVVSTSHDNLDEFDAAVQAMDQRVDGLVVMAPRLSPEAVTSIVASGGPVTFINTFAEIPGADVFNFDNYGGSYALTEHLLSEGHRRLAVVRGPHDARDARDRMRGVRDAVASAGLPAEAVVHVNGDYTQEAGFAATRVLLEMDPRPTAVLAANDYCAMGVLSGLHEAGISVPGEIAVAGFDGVTSSRYTLPPLTTVEVPIRALGYRALKRLSTRVAGAAEDDAFLHEVLPAKVVVRASTGGRKR